MFDTSSSEPPCTSASAVTGSQGAAVFTVLAVVTLPEEALSFRRYDKRDESAPDCSRSEGHTLKMSRDHNLSNPV